MKSLMRRWLGLLAAAAVGTAGAVAVLPQTAFAAGGATPGTVYYWNETLLEAFRRQGGGPGPLARAAAMMHGAVYDAINSAAWARKNYVGTGYRAAFVLAGTTSGVNDDLAAGIAARDVLIDALPLQRSYVEQRYGQRYGSTVQAAASDLAAQVVNAVRRNRSDDGASASLAYAFENVPGAWRLTGGACTAPVDTHWGLVRPFAITSASQVRRPPPGGYSTYSSLLASSFYANAVNEVQSLGRANSTTRTSEQTQIAFFWSNDANGTYKPPGQLLAHTRVISEVKYPASTSAVLVGRLFTQVSFALADAVISSWDHKYLTPIDLWRPVSAIQLADTDNNPATIQDPTWQPLGATPCFPSWNAGHAELAGAWAEVMRRLFGDAVSFTGGTEDPKAVGVSRTFTSFTQAATENARSRIYLGVHYQFDSDDGLASGTAVGTAAAGRMLYMKCYDPCSPW